MKKLLSLVLALTLCLGMAVPVCAENRTIYLASSAWLSPEYLEGNESEGDSALWEAVEVPDADLGSITLYGDLERTGTVSSPLPSPPYGGGTYDYPVYRSNGPVTVTLNSGLEEGVTNPFSDPTGPMYVPAYAGIDTMSYDKDARFYDTLKEDALYFDGKILPENLETDEVLAPVSIREFKEKGMEDGYNGYFYEGASVVLSEPGIYEVYYSSMMGFSRVSAIIHVENASSGEEQAVSFSDVPANAYYAEPVAWAVEKGITNGTSKTTFSPETTCNTAQILTFLWRASDEPEAPESALTDVAAHAYYYGAAQWAKSMGMISGDTLSLETPCTRASTVMFMWQAAGSPNVEAKTAFTDVPADADYAMAVAWAVENGVTTGTSSTAFSPDQTCTRGQIATFLYRAFA